MFFISVLKRVPIFFKNFMTFEKALILVEINNKIYKVSIMKGFHFIIPLKMVVR